MSIRVDKGLMSSIERSSKEASLQVLERGAPPRLSYDRWFFSCYHDSFSPITAVCAPSNHDPNWIQTVKCVLIVVLSPLVLLVKVGEALYFNYYEERFKERVLRDVGSDLDRLNLYIGKEIQTDGEHVYFAVLQAHGGNVRAAVQFMDFLHQGIISPQVKEIMHFYCGGNTPLEDREFLLRGPQNLAEGEKNININVDLDRKEIQVRSSLYLWSLREGEFHQIFRKIDFSLFLNSDTGAAMKRYTIHRVGSESKSSY